MKKHRKLIWRIYLAFLIIIIVSLVSVTGYTSNTIRRFFLNQTERDLKTQAYLVENKVREYLLPLQKKQIKRLTKELGSTVATRITVILPTGVVVGDSEENADYMDNHQNRPEVSEALKGNIGSSVRFSGTLSQKMMYVAIPIKEKGNIIAVLRTSLAVTSVEKELSTIQLDRIIWGILTAILASVLALVLSRRITKPIEEMRIGAEHFAMGDLNYYLPVSDTLELASLAHSMNDMATQLENRITTIVNQRNEYEAVLSSMIEGVIAVDNRERILSINQAAMDMLNIRSDNLKQRSIQEMIRNSELQKVIGDTLETEKPIVKDIVILYQDKERILNLKCSPISNVYNENIGAMVVINDVTRIRLLEDIRKDFVANVSHELKTPLTTIKGFVETLIANVSSAKPEELDRFLNIISKNVDRLNAIIEDLLSLARIEKLSEKIDLRFDLGKIKDACDTAVQIVQAQADEKHITIRVECDPSFQTKFDPTMLEQAIANLLDNAIKYSHENSEIELTVRKDEKEITISIKDQGPGIHKNHLPRLFERFYRADKARSRELGGTGLGLAIVKHVVQLHSGSVTVDSVLGKGSVFTLHLPV